MQLIGLTEIVVLIATVLVLVTMYLGIRVVPQTQVYIVERFGRFLRALHPGLNLIWPYLDQVRHKVLVLERQLKEMEISVITKDNVEIRLMATVFMRVAEADKAVYRIASFEDAIRTATTSVVRNQAGKLELDEIQSAREQMNEIIHHRLNEASAVWGIEVTRTEITDVIIDEQTKKAQRQQLNAERERRALVARATGERDAVQLAADAELYEATKKAEALKITADARAYEIETVAAAQRAEILAVGEAIKEQGPEAAEFEIRKRQVNAIAELAGSKTTTTLVLPAEVAGVLGALDTFVRQMGTAQKSSQ